MNSYRYYGVLKISASEKIIPALAEHFFALGCLGLERERENFWKVYFPETICLKEIQEDLAVRHPAYRMEGTRIGLSVPFRKGLDFTPFGLGSHFRVVPKNHPGDPGDPKTIFLDPGTAFGTGNHESTRLLADLLLRQTLLAQKFLDIGTGSGILTLLAAKLGVSRLTAVEIDPEALRVARQNFQANRISKVRLLDNIDHVKDRFETVVANLTAPTLLYLKEKIQRRLHPKGVLLLSGLLLRERGEILEGFERLRVISELHGEQFLALKLGFRL